jgi:hypothetical protein
MHEGHVATACCWPRAGAIFRQPSILRNMICPLVTRLKRTLVLVVCVFHGALGTVKA